MGLLSDPSFFVDDSVVTLRSAEVPGADFATGCNAAGSNAAGIGIGEGIADVAGTPEQFTLLDQRGLARAGQLSQNIGGEGYALPANYPSSGGQEGFAPEDVVRIGTSVADGTVTPTGNANLNTLEEGWTITPPV